MLLPMVMFQANTVSQNKITNQSSFNYTMNEIACVIYHSFLSSITVGQWERDEETAVPALA